MLYKEIKYLSFLLLLITLLISCTQTEKLPSVYITNDTFKSINIEKVRLIGPFLVDTSENNSLNTNDLKHFNLQENKLDENKILSIKANNAQTPNFIHPQFKNQEFSIIADNIDFLHLIDTINTKRNESNYYLACTIHSDKKRDIVFMAATCFGLKAWLNNNLIVSETGNIKFPKGFDYYIKLALNKGKNLFVVKVSRGSNKLCWRLVCKITDIPNAKEEYCLNLHSDFISNPIVNNNENLIIYTGNYLDNKKLSVSITNVNNNPDYLKYDTIVINNNGECELSLNNLNEGFYNCNLYLKNNTLSENFYIGNKYNLLNHLKQEFSSLNLINKDDVKSVDGAIKSLSQLIAKRTPKNSKSESKFYNKNIVNKALSIQNTLLSAKTQPKNPFKNIDGTYLKSYSSKIDDQPQYYMFHASQQTLLQEKIPLVVVMPFYHNPLDSALNSWYYLNSDQIEWEIKLADQYKTAIFWPYLRGNSGSSGISTADFFEAFNDIKSNYNIDTDRIYLMGDCAGARRTIHLASKFPHYFAAISLFQPETHGMDEITNPINFVRNLTNIPTYIYHSTKDEVVPIENSYNFITEASKYKYVPYFDKSESDSHYLLPKNCHAPTFEFFNNKKRISSPDTIRFITFEQKYNKAYWLEINKYSYIGKTIIEAFKDTLNNTINVNAINIDNYSIYTKDLNLNKHKDFHVFTNNKLSYKGNFRDTIQITVNKSNTTYKTKKPLIEGPINHFFTNSFVYVEPKTTVPLQKMITSIWGSQVFVSVKSIKEEKFRQNLNESNIILFNQNYTNPYIKQIISKLPVIQSEKNILFRNKEITESDVSICFIYPNPLNTNKYVLYIGTNNENNFSLVEKNLIVNGNKDYVVWNKKYGLNNIIKEGYFDINWY